MLLHAVTGAICVAYCVSVRGTVASMISLLLAKQVTKPAAGGVATVRIEHPSGTIDVRLEAEGDGSEPNVRRAAALFSRRARSWMAECM